MIVVVGLATRAIGHSALRAGYPVHTVDYFGDLDQKRLVPNVSLRRDLGIPFRVDALVQAAREIPADSVVYTAPLENHPEAVAELSADRRLLGNPPEVLVRVRHPHLLGRVLTSAGFRVPRLRDPGDGAPGAGRWLCKPVRSGGGHGIRPWDGGPTPPGYVVQEFVSGRPASALFLASEGEARLLAVTAQLIGLPSFGASGFRYCGNLLPLPCDDRVLREIHRLVQVLSEAFSLRGANGVDFLLTPQGPVVLEVNPRYTAAMELVECASGSSVFDLHVRACLGTLPEVAPVRVGTWGKAILYARRALRLPDTRPWLAQGVCDVPFPGDEVREGHPICTLVAWGSSQDDCYLRLLEKATALESQIYAQDPSAGPSA
jgi:predicted ATP-grasp superfamily ATP-dependent carboligase